jgi:hypothetical protein
MHVAVLAYLATLLQLLLILLSQRLFVGPFELHDSCK